MVISCWQLILFMIRHSITHLKRLGTRMSKKWWKSHKFTSWQGVETPLRISCYTTTPTLKTSNSSPQRKITSSHNVLISDLWPDHRVQGQKSPNRWFIETSLAESIKGGVKGYLMGPRIVFSKSKCFNERALIDPVWSCGSKTPSWSQGAHK